jgi:hypothetical protein
LPRRIPTPECVAVAMRTQVTRLSTRWEGDDTTVFAIEEETLRMLNEALRATREPEGAALDLDLRGGRRARGHARPDACRADRDTGQVGVVGRADPPDG